MIVGTKYFNDNLFYTKFKKHDCPSCNEKLRLIKKSKIVNSKSPEAKYYDFTSAEGFMVGDVKFVWEEFQCPKCKAEFTVKDIKRSERGK